MSAREPGGCGCAAVLAVFLAVGALACAKGAWSLACWLAGGVA